MKTNLKTSVNSLFIYLVICGVLCNIIIGIMAIINSDYILLGFCLVLAFISVCGFSLTLVGKYLEGIHLTLFCYLLTFIFASFTHVVSYSLVLIFPIFIGFGNLFFKKRNTKLVYVLVAFIGSIVTVVNTHINNWEVINYHHLGSNLVLVLGLLLGFVFTISTHSNRIERYRRERDETEKLIRDKNLSLKEYIKTNLQLENFAHLASHELKTPIKNISNFSQLLDRKLMDKLDPRNKEILDMIKSESHRMSEMMDDLLKLSQISKKKLQFNKINGHKFINNLIEENFDIENTFIAVNSFPLELVAAESHLHILFFNLIENAIKFSRNIAGPKISVYGRRSSDYYFFEVRDNGVGINDKYKESVFLIFNKLNPQIITDGSGIGLSMCKAIIDRHNGRIWIEDNPEGGTIIKFTLQRNLTYVDPKIELMQDINPLGVSIAHAI